MKTSKKLLSFFLAVVMVITTCSVGFTAFAQDNRNSIWRNNAEAADAYESLDGIINDYVPSLLLGIGDIGYNVYVKYASKEIAALLAKEKNSKKLTAAEQKKLDAAKAEIAEKATISDILEAVAPMIIGLGDGEGFSLDKESFVYEVDRYDKNQSNYDYLDTAKEGEKSFYDLYALCKTFKDDDKLSKETRDTLSKWFVKLDDLAQRYNKLMDSVAEIEKIAEKANKDYKELSLMELEALTFDFTGQENGVKSYIAEKKADFDSKFAYVITDDMSLNQQFARAVYYTYLGKDYIKASPYNHILTTANAKIGTKTVTNSSATDGPQSIVTAFPGQNDKVVSYNATDLTLDNIADKLGNTVLEAFGLDDTPENRAKAEASLAGVYYSIATVKSNNTSKANYAYYDDIVAGLAVLSGKYASVDAFKTATAVPDFVIRDEAGNVANLDEIKAIGNKLLAECKGTGEPNADGITIRTNKLDPSLFASFFDANLPERIQNTVVEDYFLIFAGNNPINAQGTAYSATNAFAVTFVGPAAYTNPNNAKGANPSATNLNNLEQYQIQGRQYGEAQALFKALGFEYYTNHVTSVDSMVDIEKTVNKVVSNNYTYESNLKVELKDDEKYNPADYSLACLAGVDIANMVLNNLVGQYIGMIEGVVAEFLVTPIDLNSVVNNILAKAYGEPLSKGTNATSVVFELLPVLVALIDEFLVPMVFVDLDKCENNKANSLLPLLYNVIGLLSSDFRLSPYLEAGSFIGVKQFAFDLNEILPALMHWLMESEKSTAVKFDYYESKTVQLKSEPADTAAKNFAPDDMVANDLLHYTAVDKDGNKLVRVNNKNNVTFTYKDKTVTSKDNTDESINEAFASVLNGCNTTFVYEFTYEKNIPVITGIYYVDTLLKGAKLSDLTKLLSSVMDSSIAKVLGEVITEIATLFTAAVDQFVATPKLVNATKLDKEGKVVTSGLNNLFVAIPQLFDIMENLSADKYGVSKNAWTYCYDGKITTDEKGTRNMVLETFKSFASSSDPNKSVDILDNFVSIFINDWLNAILSLVDTALATDNKITKNIPIVSGLLESLGGFGETSIITDVVNGVFQIDRDSKFSFTLEKRENGFTGFSSDSAYFLITNIPRLVEVITNLAGSFGGNDSDNNNNNNNNNNNKTTPVYKPKAAKVAVADKSNYTDKELSNASDLINNLDKMLSSLLADSSVNGFKLNATDNIFAGVVTFFSNYLGRDCYSDIAKLLNEYTYYITAKDTHTADSKGNVNAKKVYTNEALTGLVVETFLLVEKLAENLLADFNDTYKLDSGSKAQYNLLVEAIEGLISPDAISVRLSGYDKVQKKLSDYNCWHNAAAQTSRGDYKIKLDWGIKAGDKTAFFDGLAASLRLVTSILSVVFIDTNWYSTVISPVLGALCTKNGIKIDTAAQFKALKNGYHDEVLLGIIRPVSEWFNLFLDKPVTTLIKSIQGIAGILDDKNGATIASILKGAITPIANEVKGLGSIFALKSSKLLPTSLTLRSILNGAANVVSSYANPNNIKLGQGNYKYSLSGKNIIPIVNSYLAFTGITLKQINWNKLSTAKSPAAALVYILEYLFEVVLDNSNLTAIAKLINNDTVTMILDLIKDSKISPKDILSILNRILEATDSPALAYWTFAQYLQKATIGFVYPAGVTKQMADNGVKNLDNLIAGIFPLLGSFGVDLGGDNLQAILSKNLFKNEFVTKLAVALYGALDGLDPTIKEVLKGLGIVSSTKDVAKILTDKSYGATYTSAAKAIAAQSSWKNVKNVNWGFKDGSVKAQQGFVNALAAVLRPLYGVLEVFLNEGSLKINDVLYSALCSLNVPYTENVSVLSDDKSAPIQVKYAYSFKNGVLTLKIWENETNRKYSRASEFKFDFTSLKDLKDLKIEGTNAYNSAIIPLLEALQCSKVVTYAQYQKDVAKAKDNLLLDILNPLVGASSSSFLNKLVANPMSELTKLIPNLAMYLDGNGLIQLVCNLLAPITDIAGLTGKGSFVITDLIEMLLGAPLQDMIIPIVNSILAGSDNPYLRKLELKNINWNALISLGDAMKYTSKATGANGKYLTGKIVGNVDQGKVLITVLRYIANILVDNASVLKNLICSIDGIAKSKQADMIISIITSVFNTIGTASADQIVAAIFYLLDGQPQNTFWDYTAYKTGNYKFSYPGTVDVDFLKSLPPMLDGLIGQFINLNDTISKALFKDEMISKLATGLYGAIEGVKINDNMNLTQLLAKTDLDFSTSNVSKLLVDKAYGQQFQSASSAIAAAGSWKNVNADALKWGVKDADSFFHALVAVLRPLYGVLDVLLNDAYLGIFDIVRLPGSNGYTSSIVPLMEAFSMYNIKTQYQYRQDIAKEYDAILLDIINPLWDKVEDILNAPLETLMAILPNLALFIGNDGLCQILDNLLAPISAILDTIRPVVDLNTLLPTLFKALKFDLNGTLAKIGITNFSLDIYDINKTLKPVLSGNAIIPLANSILGMIDIKGTKLGLKLNDVDWLQLASHGTTVVSASQAATYGSRVFVQGDSSETLIALLRYLINTINTGDNFDKIDGLIGGLLGDGASESVSKIINQVMGMLKGDADTVISMLVELLQQLGG